MESYDYLKFLIKRVYLVEKRKYYDEFSELQKYS